MKLRRKRNLLESDRYLIILFVVIYSLCVLFVRRFTASKKKVEYGVNTIFADIFDLTKNKMNIVGNLFNFRYQFE